MESAMLQDGGFDQFICWKSDVTVETDHKPLISIVKKIVAKSVKKITSDDHEFENNNYGMQETF